MAIAVDSGAVRGFFEELYGDAIGAEAQLVLWSARDKRSRWADSLSGAVEHVESMAAASDPYFGVCLQDYARAREERSSRTGDSAPAMDFVRGYATTTVAMPGLWLDLDLAGPAHEKRGLPRTRGDADRILSRLAMPPTWTILTGGGLHIYWLFREVWMLDSQSERDSAAACIRGWQTMAIDAAADMGFSMDATHDLSRVLRPVGTTNHKYSEVVAFEARDGSRYNPSDFEEWIDIIVPHPPPLTERVDRLGAVSDEMQPPTEKLMAMLNLQPQFAATWRRERQEFPSQSEYDLSLASMAARAGWEEDEIVALVIAHRRSGGEPTKADRPEYYARLLGKAQAGIVADAAHERLNERVEAVSQGDSTPDEERDGFLRDVSALLGFNIRRVLKFLGDPPQYRLVLEQGTIHLGGVESILNSAKFRASIAAVSGHLIRRFRADRWDPVAQAILQSVEDLDLGADSTAEGVVYEWLGEYMTQHRPSTERQEAISVREPFFDPDGVAAFFLSEFRSWLAFHRDERLGRRQIATLLRSAGCSPRVVAYTRESDGLRTSVQVWTSPVGVSAHLPNVRETSR
tara:strand:- start:290 stop:2011 length:1722 start_codon:yes stop_codon:yes gene_type:complete